MPAGKITTEIFSFVAAAAGIPGINIYPHRLQPGLYLLRANIFALRSDAVQKHAWKAPGNHAQVVSPSIRVRVE
jgi:hypothetical protein